MVPGRDRKQQGDPGEDDTISILGERGNNTATLSTG